MDVKNMKCFLRCWDKHETMRFMRDNIFNYKLEYNDIYKNNMKNLYTYVSAMSTCVPSVTNYVWSYIYTIELLYI